MFLRVVVIPDEDHQLLLAGRRVLDTPLVFLNLRSEPAPPVLEIPDFELDLIPLLPEPLKVGIDNRGLRCVGALRFLNLRLEHFNFLLDEDDIRICFLVFSREGGQVTLELFESRDERISPATPPR